MSHDPSRLTIGPEAAPSRLTIGTGAGPRLDTDLWIPSNGSELGVVCCHPHPQFGGSRSNHVVEAMFRSAIGAGVASLRFDFRGVGRSTGPTRPNQVGDIWEGDRGQRGGGEGEDVLVAIDHLATLGVDRVLLAGYSFGGDIALACDHPAVVGWLAVAAPLAVVPVESMRAGLDPRPVWLAMAEHDQFRTVDDAEHLTATWVDRRIEVIPMADHFLGGSAGFIERLTAGVIARLGAPAGDA